MISRIAKALFLLFVFVAVFMTGANVVIESELWEIFFVSFLEAQNTSPLDAISNILGITAIFFGALVLFVSILRTVRSTSEKAEQEIASRFSIEEKDLRRQIEAERDAAKKETLEWEISALRQKYESLLSENLQRSDGTFVKDWREVLLVARKRLSLEQQRLRRRNAVNLTFGVVGLLAGLSVLIYFRTFTLGLEKDYSFVDFLIAYWSRVGTVITLGVFSGFFLRLYSLTERVIERNKSDLTNIELRLTAGLMLYEEKNKEKFAILADNISKEDSKFILGKDESTGGVSTNKLLETIFKTASKGGE